MRVSAHARRGKRLRAIVAQSRDRASVLRNLGILRMRNAISRLRKFSDCAEHIHEVMMHENVVSTSLVLRSHAAFIASFHFIAYSAKQIYPMNAASGLGMRLATFAVNRASV